MPHNGAVSRLLPEPAATPAGAEAPTSKPGSEIEVDIGGAVADGVIVLALAVDGYLQTGALDPAAKARGAEHITMCALGWLDFAGGDLEFLQRARAAGGRELKRRYADVGVRDVDAALDELIGDLLGVVQNIVRDERIWRSRRAH